MKFLEYVDETTREQIINEWSFFGSDDKKKDEEVSISSTDLKNIFNKAISLAKKEVNKIPLLKKYVKFDDITDFDTFTEKFSIHLFSIDAWDITSKARDDDEYDKKVTPVYDKVYAIEKILNNEIKKDPLLKNFEYDTDGDWDDSTLYFQKKSGVKITITDKGTTDSANRKYDPKTYFKKAGAELKKVLNDPKYKDIKNGVKLNTSPDAFGTNEFANEESKWANLGPFRFSKNDSKLFYSLKDACDKVMKNLGDDTYSIRPRTYRNKVFDKGYIHLENKLLNKDD